MTSETRVLLMECNQTTWKGVSPTRLLTIACAFTLSVLALLGWNSFDSYRAGRRAAERNSRIAELRSRILHFDEVLTMSARMAAATGDPEWENRYRTFKPQLNAAIQEAKIVAREAGSSSAAARIDAANTKLVAMEIRAFELVRQGRTDEAQGILFGDEYENQKAMYAQGMIGLIAPGHGGLPVAEVRRVIIHFNEVMMMSARMAAATGDLKWETRYRAFEAQLDAAIKEALAIQEKYHHDGTRHAAQIDAANTALVETANRSFDLVSARRFEAARALFAGDDFEEQQKLYATAMENLAKDLAQTKIAISRSEANRATWRISSILLAIGMTVGTWLVVLRLLRDWQKRLTTANADLAAKGTELAELNAGLDQRVRDKTSELHEAKDFTDNIIGSIIDMLVVVGPDGRIVMVNKATCDLSGFREEELIGQPASMLFLEEDITQRILSKEALPLERTVLRRLVGQDSIYNIETSVHARVGEDIPVLMTGSVIRDKNGRTDGVVCVAQDITERKQVENELRKLSVAVEQSPATVVITDTNGTIEYVNPRFTEITGYAKEEAIGQNPRILKSGKWPRKAYEGLWNTILSGKTWRGEFENKKKNGDLYWESASISPVRNAQGEITHFLAIKEDITKRKQREEELQKAKTAAEAANQAKSEFLANMSHEIRTPMTAILGFAENMLDGDQPESEKLNCIHTIRRNGEYLLGIINDILDLSKIEAGKMTIECRDCHPCRVVAEVASLMRVRADAKGLSFHNEYVGAIPETIQSDPTRLRQILINLIGNAIKFTEVGEIRLVTRLVDDADDDPERAQGGSMKGSPAEPYLQFEVIDTGSGMTADQKANLFQPFMQADTSTTRNFGGTGLGLTISKRFAELLGGHITVPATEIGVGTTFRATVAAGPLDGVRMLDDPTSATVVDNSAGTGAQGAPSDLRGLRILLVEDGPDNRRLISFILKKAGADVTTEANGKLALDSVLAAMHRRREGDPERPYDIILMDMQMPVMDGYEATRQLRKKGYTGPIIALTAHAMGGDREKCIKAGCDDYATKPVDRRKLVGMILQHVQDRRLKPDTEQTETPQRPSLHSCGFLPVADNTSDVLVSDLTDDEMFELVQGFVSELPERVAAIERALGEQDLAALRTLSHQLKGSAGGYGFPSITDAAGLLESSTKTGENLETLTEQTRALTELCHRAHDGVGQRPPRHDPARTSVSHELPPPGGGNGTVLVVDDDPDARHLFRELLERDGFQVHEACDGNDALAKAPDIRPHVVLMDVEMPKMDGLECTRKFKADPALRDIPIIIVSGRTDSRHVRAGLEVGAQEYMTKPIQHDEFLLRVRAMNQLFRGETNLYQSNAVRGEQARAMSILFDLSRSLAAAESIDAIVAHTVASTAELMNSCRVSVMLPDDAGRNLFVASAIGIDDGLAAKIEVPMGNAIAGKVFTSGEPMVVNSKNEAIDCTGRYESEFFASVPLASKALAVPNKVVGVLNVTERYDRQPFETHEIEYLDLVCNMTASAIEQFQSGQAREHAHAAIVIGLAKLAEHRDCDTGKHLERVTRFALLLAGELRKSSRYESTIDDRFLMFLKQAMPLHDIGKVSVSDAILLKPGKLTDAEFAAVKRHADVGASAIQSVIDQAPEADFLVMARDIAHSHHEWFDGSGYPQGLAREGIPPAARIAAVADVYDALTTKRSYKGSFPHEEAVGIIQDSSGSQFDPDVVDVFLRLERDFAVLAQELRDETDDAHEETAERDLVACSTGHVNPIQL